MLYATDFRKKARESLKNNWGKAVGAGIVASLLGVGTSYTGALDFNFGEFSSETSNWNMNTLDGIIPKQYQLTFIGIMSFILVVVVAIAIVQFLIGGAVTIGYAKFHLNLVDGKLAMVSDLFSEFKRWKTAFVMQFLRSIYTILWTLLFIIPGIRATYSYAMAPYILLENKGMTGREAIAKSKELMEGNRFRLFCLSMSFFGWHFLCIMVTFGIGYLWLIPYQQASFAVFYREISKERYGQKEEDNIADFDKNVGMDQYEDNYRYRTSEEEEKRYSCEIGQKSEENNEDKSSVF